MIKPVDGFGGANSGISAVCDTEAPDAGSIDSQYSGRDALSDNQRAYLTLLFNKYRGPLFRYLNGLVSSPDDVRELVQESYLRLMRHTESVPFEAVARSYLFQTATNLAKDYFRRNVSRRRSQHESIDEAEGLHSHLPAEHLAVWDQTMDRLRTVIQAMPEEWRDVFILSRFDDQSPLAIAEMLPGQSPDGRASAPQCPGIFDSQHARSPVSAPRTWPPSFGRAARWFVRLRWKRVNRWVDGNFRLWLKSDQQHQEDLLRIELMWELAGELKHDSDIQDRVRAVHASARARRRSNGIAKAQPRRFARSPPCWSLQWQVSGSSLRRPKNRSIQRKLARQRQLTLPDGSVAMLNTSTQLRFRLVRGIRRVDLDRGEATFGVRRDAAHPFVVHAGPVTAEALGTHFNVLKSGGDGN